MSLKVNQRTVLPEEYLKGELRSDVRHDLVGGQVYARVGASNIHNLLATTRVRLLGAQLHGWEMELYDERDALRLESVDYHVPVAELYREVLRAV